MNQLVSGRAEPMISDVWGFSIDHSISPSEGARPRSTGTSGLSRAEWMSSVVFLPEATPEIALAILRT